MAKANRLYKSYNFVDKDPVIDKLRTIIKREGHSYSELSELSGVSVQTFYNWFDGNTRRPQYATIAAVIGALGYRISFVASLTGHNRRAA